MEEAVLLPHAESLEQVLPHCGVEWWGKGILVHQELTTGIANLFTSYKPLREKNCPHIRATLLTDSSDGNLTGFAVGLKIHYELSGS